MADEAVVSTRLEYIHQYTEELREMRDCSKVEYLDDVIRQRAVERSLMNVIQSCIDLASHVRASEELGDAETAREEIEALERANIVSTETEQKLGDAVGLRNRLAHRYDDIDHEIIYDVVHEELQWFDQFQREIASWFQDTHS